jgi:hypothetical protein
VAARHPNGPKVLEVACANPICGKVAMLTGRSRVRAVESGRGG